MPKYKLILNEDNDIRNIYRENKTSITSKIVQDSSFIPKIKTLPTTSNKNIFGETLKTVGSTTADLLTNVGKGFLGSVESGVDAGRYAVAGIADVLGVDDFAKKVRKNAEFDVTGWLTKDADELYNKKSVLKENGIIENVAKGVGQVGATVGTSALLPTGAQSIKLGKLSIPTTSIITGAGSGIEEARKDGASEGKALLYGGLKGIIEGATEGMFGGLGKTFNKFTGGGALDEVVAKKLSSNISNKVLSNLVNAGVMSVGEGTEEVVSSVLDPIAKKIYSDKSLKELYKDTNLLEDFVVGSLTSAILQAPSTITNLNNSVGSKSNSRVESNELNTLNSQKKQQLQESINKYVKTSPNIINMTNVLNKVIDEKGYNIVFDDTIKNKFGKSVNAQIQTLNNGQIEIKLNPNSPRAGEFLVVHEITHAIETDSMKKLILDYASRNTEFKQSLESLKQAYGVEDVSSEVVADISGQLFGNQEFINSLSIQEPSIFKRIYNKIIELANKITGNSNEALFIKDLKNKWETAYRNTTTEQAVNNLGNEIKTSEKLGGYVPDINVTTNEISKYNISNYNDLKEVKQKIYDYYKDDYISTEQISKPITNIDTGLKIEIWKNGIMETFGNASYYKNLSITDKKIKLATMDSLAKMIKYGEIRANSATNYHNSNSTAEYYYLDHPITIDGNKYMVNMDIRKVPNYNGRFYIHSIDTKKVGTPGTSKKSPLMVPTNDNNIPQNNKNVKSGTSTMYSMQENINNTQELDNSSFSLEERVSGDTLLDAQDLIDEVKSVGANVDENGYITVYHQTTKENADKIRQSGKMIANEDYVYFSTSNNASQSEGRGQTKLEFKIPAEKLLLDDIFSDNADLKVPLKGSKTLDVSNYLVNDTKYSQQNDNSSFSLEEKLEKYVYPQHVYERYKNEDKSKIVETIEELKKYKETLDTDTDEGWNKNFETNQKINALENGFDNVYENLVESEKNRLRKEAKEESGLGYRLLQEGIKQEEKNNQLQNDIANSTPFKNAQFQIIQQTNPAPDETNYVWIRSPKDIKTFNEVVVDDSESFNWGDFTIEDAKKALHRGNVTVYSSYPIKNGVFVSTSYQQALDYAGGEPSKVHSRKVALDSVAWINGDEGQYAKVNTKYSQENKTWQDYLEKNYKATGTRTYFKDTSKVKTLPMVEKQKESNVKLLPSNKTLNPNEISQLNIEDANTTPIPPNVKVSTGAGESKFYNNITEKTKMLNEDTRTKLLGEKDIEYYEKVTNELDLEKAFNMLNEGGSSETLNWFNKKSETATSVDIAEGWILLKQYSDEENYDGVVQVAKKMREMGTKAGQTVQAFNILSRLTPEGMVKYAQSELSEAYEKMIKNKSQKWIDEHRSDFDLTPDEVKFIMNTMQEVAKMEDGYNKKVKLAEIQKLMTDKLPPDKGAGTKSWMRISMLFNPKTQVRNVLGNAVIAPVNALSDLVASKVDKVIANKTGIRTTGTTNVKSYAEGFKNGLFQSYNDFKKGINTRNIEGNRFEITTGKSFNDRTLIGKALNNVDSLLSFMLDAGDRSFYEGTFTNSINNQLVLNDTTEVTKDMVDIATSEALQRTWQDNNNYTKFVLNARKGLNQLLSIRGYGLGDVLIPFAKTPANLTKAIIDYSPVGIINAINSGRNLKNSLSNGQYTPQMQHEFVQNLGKATAGTILYILGYALAKVGITSGKSDDDKDVANFMKNALGVSSYSIKIGNKTFSYDWAQPIAAPLSIMANIVNKQKEGATLIENILSSLDTAGNILLEQSFMESINTVLNNNNGLATGIQEALLELPSRAIPTLMKQIVDLTDGTQRQTFEYNKPIQTSINKIKAKIPGLSTTLSPTVDTLGREIQKYGGKNNVFNVFFNPANVNSENISESAKEIYKIYQETGNASVMPRQTAYYINKDNVKMLLTSKQRAEFQKVSGNIIEDSVSKLKENNKYTSMTSNDKAEVISNIVNYAYNKAREEVLGIEMSNQYNKAQEWIEKGNTIYDYYVNKEEADYSLENPRKYNTITKLGISYDDYVDYQKEVNKIKEEYYGTDNSKLRKQKVFDYINSLSYNKNQKIILFNLLGNYSISQNKQVLFQYINKQNLTKKEKEEIWNYLYK